MNSAVMGYKQVIEHIFFERYNDCTLEEPFEAAEIHRAAKKLGVALPTDLGFVIEDFRHRATVPESVRKSQPDDATWIISRVGKSRFVFILIPDIIIPHPMIGKRLIPDLAHDVSSANGPNSKETLLERIRRNRLVDIFTGVPSYSLQTHLQNKSAGVLGVEPHDIYIGVTSRKPLQVFPIRVKMGSDYESFMEIEKVFAICKKEFPQLICRVIGIHAIDNDTVALFEFVESEGEMKIAEERHYRFIRPELLRAMASD